jgi:hypothetical protein
LSHYFGFAKLHFHLPIQQSSYKRLSFKFDPFFTRFHHWTFTILIILDNITLCSSQPNRDKERITRPHENKISIVEISK